MADADLTPGVLEARARWRNSVRPPFRRVRLLWRRLDGDAVAEQGEVARAFRGAAALTTGARARTHRCRRRLLRDHPEGGKAEILPGLATELWGYDGIFPGPTIESRSGRKIVVRYHNKLPVPVTTHLHGGRTPPGSDGYPTDLILPKSSSSHTHHGTPWPMGMVVSPRE